MNKCKITSADEVWPKKKETKSTKSTVTSKRHEGPRRTEKSLQKLSPYTLSEKCVGEIKFWRFRTKNDSGFIYLMKQHAFETEI